MQGGSSSLVVAIVRKTAGFAVAVLIIMSAVFLTFMVMTGDPIHRMQPPGPDRGGYWEFVERARLNDSIIVQYIDYIVDTITGDLRVTVSFQRGTEIQDIIWDYIGNTTVLLSLALAGSLGIGLAVHRVAMGGRRGARSAVLHGLSMLLALTPAISLAMTFSMANVELNLQLPVSGDGVPAGHDTDRDAALILKSLLLPVLASALSAMGLVVLILRDCARRHSGDPKATWPFCVKPASDLARLRPFLHFYVAWTMAVVILVDIVFSYGGLGQLLWDALRMIDMSLLMAIVLTIALIVLVTASTLSLVTSLVAGMPMRRLLDDWGRMDPASSQEITPVEGTTWSGWRRDLWLSFRGSKIGLTAVALLGVLSFSALLAPTLAAVDDPSSIANLEPNVYPDWVNPLLPSLDPSPHSGITHLFGTDYIGRDMYSLWLFALRPAVATTFGLMIGAFVIGLAIGAIASKTVGVRYQPARVLDFVFSAVARAAVVTPLLVIAVSRTAATGTAGFMVFHLLAAFYAWAWIFIVRPIRQRARIAGSSVNMNRMAPSMIAESLCMAKFSVPLLLVTDFSSYAIGMGSPGDLNLGSMAYSGFSYTAYLTGDWHMVIVPILGIALIACISFVLLDRLEHAVRNVRTTPIH